MKNMGLAIGKGNIIEQRNTGETGDKSNTGLAIGTDNEIFQDNIDK